MKRFKIVLLIRHPSIDPMDISRELKLKAFRAWKAGDPRTTPKGTVLGGTRDRTSWNHIFRYEGDLRFFEEAERLVSRLRKHKDFFAKLIKEGGDAEIYFQLPGDVNQGDSAKPSLLKVLAELGLRLGIEVFPHER